MPLTLRERSRLMIGQEISDTALRLFTEQGFEQTTIAQIAREAGVSQRTLFRYFGTKEDLIGGGEDTFAAVLTEIVESQPADVPAWTALRAGFLAVLAPARQERMRVILGTASLRARFIEKRLRLQDAVLPIIEARMGIGEPDRDPRARTRPWRRGSPATTGSTSRRAVRPVRGHDPHRLRLTVRVRFWPLTGD
ncbi:AcrR family transcriptional regulator [Amycolatopsis lexingtonensis]|uniref:AcrR family transcriptional regulator n=1 Tax=Amycolatopsis lexingtonensis TaxID=218822 RepID=A0ABR9HSJ0_9PSEU|nr:TetR/AcrR family transcriptional regulator [Amycolatopsis lexingtonensis]MBE1493894.1 AcrR family transcriptional regulator [Amycolatopsis lexingtonensis]